jgi:hypothetical protein
MYFISLVAVIVVFIGFWAFGWFESPPADDTCVLPTGFRCLDYSLTPTGAYITIENVMADDVIVEDISIKGCSMKDSSEVIHSRARKKIEIDKCDVVEGDRGIELRYQLEDEKMVSGLGKITASP